MIKWLLTGWVAAARLGGATKSGSNRNNVIGNYVGERIKTMNKMFSAMIILFLSASVVFGSDATSFIARGERSEIYNQATMFHDQPNYEMDFLDYISSEIKYYHYYSNTADTSLSSYEDRIDSGMVELVNEDAPRIPNSCSAYTIQLCYGENPIILSRWVSKLDQDVLGYLIHDWSDSQMFQFGSGGDRHPLPFYLRKYNNGYHAVRFGFFRTLKYAIDFNNTWIKRFNIDGQILRTTVDFREFQRYWYVKGYN